MHNIRIAYANCSSQLHSLLYIVRNHASTLIPGHSAVEQFICLTLLPGQHSGWSGAMQWRWSTLIPIPQVLEQLPTTHSDQPPPPAVTMNSMLITVNYKDTYSGTTIFKIYGHKFKLTWTCVAWHCPRDWSFTVGPSILGRRIVAGPPICPPSSSSAGLGAVADIPVRPTTMHHRH